MKYHFKNLVFEGGGVKGIAYLGAFDVLEKKGILPQIKRVGGTSAGAINAALVACDIPQLKQKEILKALNFNDFLDGSWGYVRDIWRLFNEFGWYRGDFFENWVEETISKYLGEKNVTFGRLREMKMRDLYIVGTNLSTGFPEVFSYERTPEKTISSALRISMSIPLFFRAVRALRGDVYVDGGVFDNFPVKLFDRMSYIEPLKRPTHARTTTYYDAVNFERRETNPYIYNRETLGFRLDSKKEIAVFRDGQQPVRTKIQNFRDYSKQLISCIMENQSSQHLHSDDWQRTIYIDTVGVKTTDFDLEDSRKEALIESGRKGAQIYFDWYDKSKEPVNKPETPIQLLTG